MMTYKVLIPIQSDRNGKSYAVGDIVTEKDFPKAVIANWLKLDPPVLEEAKPKGKEDNDNGRDHSAR